MHDFVVAPLTAEMVIVSPELPPAAETVGVVSFVMLSVVELPESDADARSGAAGVAGVATTVMSSDGPADDTFPALSVSVALVVHVPADSVGRSHDCVPVPMVYAQLTVVEPLVALRVTCSPVLPPLDRATVGVVSVVTLSDVEVPVSDDVARSGAPGVLGAAESTFKSRLAEAAEVCPDTVCVAEIAHVPSLKVPSSHPPVVPDAVNVHVTDDEPALVAVTVTDAPAVSPVRSICGVLSEVRLSLEDVPESDDVARSGVPVAGIPTAVAAADSDVAEPCELVAVSA